MIGDFTFLDECYDKNPAVSITHVVKNSFKEKEEFFKKLGILEKK
jgi:hypothetical protein